MSADDTAASESWSASGERVAEPPSPRSLTFAGRGATKKLHMPRDRRLPALQSARVVVLFRLILTVILDLFKRRIHPLDESVVAMRIWPNDLDLNMHANSGRYISFMDVGRLDLLVRIGMLKVLRLGWRPLAAGAIITYRRSLLPFERFRLRSRLLCWDEKWFYFEHRIEKSDGQLAAIAHVRGLLRGPQSNVSSREFLAVAGFPDLESPPMPDVIVRWRAAEGRA